MIIYSLLDGSAAFFGEVSLVEFLTGTKWVPSEHNGKFGVLPLFSGTLLIAGGAILIAGPIGIGGAIYLSEFAPSRLRKVFKPVIEVLAGIPSIVYGFFALMVISPYLRDWFGANYFNAGSAIIVVSVMILPIIISISDDALNSVPRHLREASRAMGATEWETATRIVTPAARSGITASMLLALARAIGETMAVTLAAGTFAHFSIDPREPTQTMTAYIAQTATGDIPPGVAVDAGFAVGLLLFVITYIINLVAQMVIKQRIKASKFQVARRKLASRVSLRIVRLRERLAQVLPPLTIGRGGAEVPDAPTDNFARRFMTERVGKTTLLACLGYAVLFLVFLLYQIIERGIGELNLTFITNPPSGFVSRDPGISTILLGSLYLMGLTMLLVMPVGIGAAIYLVEFAPNTWYTRFLRGIIQNLAGVPSIIFGLVGLAVFVRVFDFERSLLAGALTLAIMTLPMVVVTTEEALKNVPNGFREASLAVGATRWQTVRHHVLPNAIPGIVTGGILSMSRAIGETAPLLFIGSFYVKHAPSGLFDPFMALPLTIFYWTVDARQPFQDRAASTILVLLIILLMMNAVAIYIRTRAEARRNW